MQEQRSIFVVEYSLSQDAWHVDDLQTTLKRNREWCVQGPIGNDYKIIALADTRDEAHVILKRLRQALEATRSAEVIVQFFSPDNGGREQVPELDNQGYSPYLRVSGSNDRLWVEFADGPDDYAFDEEVDAQVRFLDARRVSYESLSPGTTFEIIEEARVVGYGRVVRLGMLAS